MVFLVLIIGIYVSTETIVPREYKYVKLGPTGPKLEFNYAASPTLSFPIDNLTSINQFLLTKIEAEFDEKTQAGKASVWIEYNVYADNDTLLFTNLGEYKLSRRKDNFLKSNSTRIFLPYVYNLRKRSLTFSIKVANPQDLTDKIKAFHVLVETNNENFFYFFWYFKWLLFGLSIYSAVKFNRSYWEQLKQTRTLEQGHIIVLGVLLVVYNFPVSFYINETHPTIYFILLTSFINIVFYSYIIYLWLTTFEVP